MNPGEPFSIRPGRCRKSLSFIRSFSFILCLGSVILNPCPASPSDLTEKSYPHRMKNISIVREGDALGTKKNQRQIVSFLVEVASDAKSLNKGLSGRASLPLNQGMLFMLDKSIEYSFWMKGMNFPLDILFFDETGRLFNIFENLVPCTECLMIKPSAPAAFALEINSGMTDRFDIRIGDRLFIEEKGQ